MTAVLPLVEALRSLAPSGIIAHAGEAPSDATLPWLVLNMTLPDSERTEGGHTAGTGELLVTVAGLTEDQTILWADRAVHAWRGARVTVPGWQVGALVQRDDVAMFPDDVTIASTNRRVQVAKIHFAFTCSETED
jgi:hypothetical protein